MTAETVRLHISPLTPALLPAVLGPALIAAAENVSYHDIQTFPENSYGFVDLPKADAERLKRKLSGAILKGSKMKVDEAKPKKRRRTEAADEATDEQQSIETANGDRKKKRKSTKENIVAGHELSPERKVKRAWTEPRKKKRSKSKGADTEQEASKYTDKEELLFRTNVPANKTDLVVKKDKKSKKSKSGRETTTIHEFEKTTTQPTFLKEQNLESKQNLTYEDGKGWVNAQGDVVEPEPKRAAQERARVARRKRKVQATQPVPSSKSAPDQGVETSETSNESESDNKATSAATKPEQDKSTGEDAAVASVEAAVASPSSASQSSEVANKQDAVPVEAHPLESLFKRPQKPTSQDVAKPSLEISTAFSFFDHDTDEDPDEPPMPLTPFTSQDLRSRGLRSAAPTPDTAFPSRFNSHSSPDIDRENDGDAHETYDNPANHAEQFSDPKASPSRTPTASTVSDFEKHFWEKRGENNRAWKARRRAVLKEKRHRENKARRPKNW
ncbi:uncharacterized protein AB675_9157 [Cyphellophora attinorum]|uniref:Suppressor protein SRP40 n=1 Tax=Cyphellophora attinorum TaxID=1664694 RepID=A0A0N1HBV4_9EURO|nr:uncharacterized protein AB675_9157 [Phialophora attinorum]KPI41624.1 hypothetical protein AB675_9157 [Phialophora attinorum]